MEILFNSGKLRRICSDESVMIRKLGDQVAVRLKDRLFDLWSVSCLSDLSRIPGARPHPLSGDRAGQFAVDVDRSVRIVFAPAHNPIPRMPDGGVDRSQVTAITVTYVGDYHE